MKIAIGIIAIVLSFIVTMQALAVTGLSGMAGEESAQQSGAIGILIGLLIFIGGAFSFGLPRVAAALFIIAFLLSWIAKKDFPDMQLWGWVAAIFSVLLNLWGTPKNKESNS